MDSLIGKTLSHYRIVEQIGAGGMGVVYRAHDETLRRDVALKVLPASFAADPARLRRFEQEARAAGALNHPNILAIYDFGEHDGAPYVISELLEGRTLRAQMGGRALPVRKAVDYAIQIARGLSAAHEKGIVHRDLKPENLFVTGDGRVKILDFGIAKLMRPEAAEEGEGETAAATETQAGVVLGTTGYMSPEQVRGEAVDHRSDIFALGAVLYEMLSGRRAFSGRTPADTMSAILSHDPPSLPTIREDVLPDLDRAVRRCLEKSPRERFQTAWDLASDLERLAESGSPAAQGRSRRWLWPVAAGFGVTLLVALAALTDVGLWKNRLLSRIHPSMIRSLAVLPLENFSRDPEQEYFVDGMTEELTSTLAQVGALKVISRTSSMQYKGTKKSLPEIGRELGADAVIEGSVLRAGDRVRVTAQLVRASTDEHLWAQSYERDLKDVLALQSGVARLIAGEVAKVLSPRGPTNFAADRAVDPAAHEDYLMGRFFWNMRTEEGLAKAIGYFRRSVERDSTYARAYSAIADYYNVLPFYTRVSPREAFPQARAAALHALAIDESLGGAHAALAFEMAYYEWDWAGAEREFQRALALTPSDSKVHHSYSRYLASTGRYEEGMAELKRAQELDPLSTVLKANEGTVLFFEGKYDEAIAQLRKVVERDPKHPVGHWGLGLALEQKGMYSDAAREIQEAIDVGGGPDPNFMSSLGHVYAAQGKREDARRLIDRLRDESKKGYVSPYHAAVIYAGLGEKDKAFGLLDQAAQERSTMLVYLRKDPRLAILRSDPRFDALLNRIGLPG